MKLVKPKSLHLWGRIWGKQNDKSENKFPGGRTPGSPFHSLVTTRLTPQATPLWMDGWMDAWMDERMDRYKLGLYITLSNKIDSCDWCQWVKQKIRKEHAVLPPIQVKGEAWTQVGMNLVGPPCLYLQEGTNASWHWLTIIPSRQRLIPLKTRKQHLWLVFYIQFQSNLHFLPICKCTSFHKSIKTYIYCWFNTIIMLYFEHGFCFCNMLAVVSLRVKLLCMVRLHVFCHSGHVSFGVSINHNFWPGQRVC